MIGSKLSAIQSGLIDAISNIVDVGSVQQEDFNKASFPLYNVYLNPEERSLDSPSKPSMVAFRNVTTFDIYCYDKIPTEGSNALFTIDSILNDRLFDIKQMLALHPTLDGLVELIEYSSSRREKSAFGDDIFIPKVLIVTVTVNYNEDAKVPTINGYV